jgi:hypothetical protein
MVDLGKNLKVYIKGNQVLDEIMDQVSIHVKYMVWSKFGNNVINIVIAHVKEDL